VNQVMITLVPVTVATPGPVTCRSVVEALADSAETRPRWLARRRRGCPRAKPAGEGPQQSMCAILS
jgi:hypothetical protein